jgi:hypothetical protein
MNITPFLMGKMTIRDDIRKICRIKQPCKKLLFLKISVADPDSTSGSSILAKYRYQSGSRSRSRV